MSKPGRELQVTVCWAAGWTIYLSGELDAAGSSQLDRVGAALTGAQVAAVDFDLSAVTFMDTAGWANLAAVMSTVEASGAITHTRNPSPAVRRLMNVVRRLPAHPAPGEYSLA